MVCAASTCVWASYNHSNRGCELQGLLTRGLLTATGGDAQGSPRESRHVCPPLGQNHWSHVVRFDSLWEAKTTLGNTQQKRSKGATESQDGGLKGTQLRKTSRLWGDRLKPKPSARTAFVCTNSLYIDGFGLKEFTEVTAPSIRPANPS